MMNRQDVVNGFCHMYPTYQHIRSFFDVNEWGDIVYHGKLIAISDLHDLSQEEIRAKTPTKWEMVE
ncbi:MAG: hypothetical protein Q4B22_02000 [Eubacteriales bacterium]|nr:hypothetical protein [Eubacteriales bacterium]